MTWELPIGARPGPAATRFRVWAPGARQAEVLLYGPDGPRAHLLAPEPAGYMAAEIPGVGPGARYRYRLDGGDPRPDPASRAQPEGVHGPSEVVDPSAFPWTDAAWRGLPLAELVIYELHVGAATPEGTFDGLIPRLDALKELGVTALELLPVADFPGDRNWGYDGVSLFAPARAYGGAEGLRRLVDAAHARGLAVILDVVYNHLGPDGNYLWSYSRDYFTSRHTTPWGDALNFDGPERRPVRDFFIGNALHWAHEYHLDGLRLDATHAMIDESPTHLLAELAATVRASLPAERHFVLIAENDEHNPEIVRQPETPSDRRWGLDGVWADDFHHQVRVALTGEREGYFAAYTGSAEDLALTINGNWFYRGQAADGQAARGAPAGDLAAPHFIYCIQNHDQVGNRALGERLNHEVGLAAYRAASALLLLCPQTPLLWMGQEWAATSPFLFFTDHNPALGRLVTEGRRAEFAGFTAFSGAAVPDPQDAATFERSRLRWEERALAPHAGVLRLYQDLLALRRSHPALRERGRDSYRATPLGQGALALERRGPAGEALLVAVSLTGPAQLELGPATAGGWRVLVDSEAAAYGGSGDTATVALETVRLPGPGAVVLVDGS